MRRVIFLILGFGALALAGIGLALPVMPTTPFVICAAGCFGASSPRLYQKLASTRYFGEYIRNYKDKSGISQKARWTGIIFLWVMLGISGAISQKPLVIGILAAVGIAVTIHILTIRRQKPEA